MTTGPETPPPPDDSQQPGYGLPPDDQQPPPGYGQQPGPPPPSQGYSQPPPGPSQGYGRPPVGPAQGYGQPPQPYATGQQPMRPDEEKLWAIGAHLGPLVLGLIAPLVVWLVFKDRSAFLDRTGKEALNMQISYAIYGLVAGFLIILLVGILLLPLVLLAWFVLMIVATIKVANFEEFRYPGIIRFVK